VGRLEVHIAYECTPGRTQRDFLQVFVPDERGLVRPGRSVDVAEYAALINALLACKEIERVSRALNQPGTTDWHSMIVSG
jgi:hypothetical protein